MEKLDGKVGKPGKHKARTPPSAVCPNLTDCQKWRCCRIGWMVDLFRVCYSGREYSLSIDRELVVGGVDANR